jgi:hypothetical protein
VAAVDFTVPGREGAEEQVAGLTKQVGLAPVDYLAVICPSQSL